MNHNEVTLSFVTNALIEKKITPSHHRIKILEYLHKHQIHPTVDQIYNHLLNEMPTLSKSTVYNTLNLFTKVNLVNMITIEDNETRYDIMTDEHGHFKCESCGSVTNFTIHIDDFTSEELSDYHIQDKEVYFKGVCPRCLQNKDKHKEATIYG